MASPTDTAALDTTPDASADQVAAYLRRHPDFLIDHPELLDALAPPSRIAGDGGGVVDMQTFMIDRLRREIGALRDEQSALVSTSRRSLSKQRQVHAAAIAMLGATTFEHLIEVVTVDFLSLLDLDVSTLCVENCADSVPSDARARVLCVEPGIIDAVLGAGHDRVCAQENAGDARVFGAGAGLVRSAALVRIALGASAPACLLALGSRRAGRFGSGRNAELIDFLARALELCMRTWLDLPAAARK